MAQRTVRDRRISRTNNRRAMAKKKGRAERSRPRRSSAQGCRMLTTGRAQPLENVARPDDANRDGDHVGPRRNWQAEHFVGTQASSKPPAFARPIMRRAHGVPPRSEDRELWEKTGEKFRRGKIN